MPLYFVTGSRCKFREIQEIIPDIKQIAYDLTEIQSLDPHEIIEAKLKQVKNLSGEFIVEDTSLCIDSLNGLPGPFIKWFLQTLGVMGISKISQGSLAFGRTIIGYSDGYGLTRFFVGAVYGMIVEPRGSRGFGWDPIFQPNGYDKTFAEMSLEDKNKLSMRSIAARSLKQFLDTRN